MDALLQVKKKKKWGFGKWGLQNFLHGVKGKISVFGNNLMFPKFCICRRLETLKYLKGGEERGENFVHCRKIKTNKILFKL